MFGPVLDVQILSRCRKSARHCGGKHISKSNVLKTEGFKPILKCQLTNLTNFFYARLSVNKTTSDTSKVAQNPQFLTHLTSKCASRHNGLHFFDISTSKSAPELRCLVHFDLQMCFAHLCATTACTVPSFIWRAGSAPATLASLLFDPPEPQNICKTMFHDFPTFSRTCIFFFLTFSTSYLLLSDFLHVRVSSWLCFSICPYCRKFSFQTSFV